MRYERYNPPLSVVGFVATRVSDPERGPLIRMRGDDARVRLLQDGELVWLYGPRRHELVTVRIDDSLPRGSVILRDVAGAAPADVVRVVKVDPDIPREIGNLA
jgi:anaerobic selenocysteine-containing dehydrogenase